MATPNYDINYDDERFTVVETEEEEALAESDKLYDGMISSSDKHFQDQINATKDWADTQTKIQNEQTEFAIEQIEQQKEQAKKDYTKEQSGAYVDWQKQSNPYGANAEKMASQGLAGSGYSESSQVRMYTTYQNRVMTAREAYSRAVLNYDNAIKDARLQNNSVLAEIAYEALQKELELSLAGFQYKNTLILAKADKQTEIKNTYYQRYQDVLKQINTENAIAEEVRQHNEEMTFKEAQFAWTKEQATKSSSSGGSIKKTSSGSSKTSSGSSKQKTSSVQEVKNVLAGKGEKNTVGATVYLNQLIKSGASKDKVANEIALALRNGEITKGEAAKLRSTFTPRGLTY